ncbi:MAG: nucleotidyltransferase domain-containing protein [Anaerolineae bacterium]
MLKALEERRRQREEFVDMARTYAEVLRGRLGKLTAIVYGSVSRGDFNLGSDVDVLIISEGLPRHPLERMEVLYSCHEPPLEPKGYTLAEFRALLAKRNSAIAEILKDGITVVDELGLSSTSQLKTLGRR